MDIDEPLNSPEMPGRKPGAPKRDVTPNEAEHIIMHAATEVVSAQGGINILSHLQTTHLRSEEVRIPSDGPLAAEPLSEIERFYGSDHESHLLKISALEDSISRSKQSTFILDETDTTGKTLWDHIPEETKLELDDQLKNLRDLQTVREQLEKEAISFCEETWGQHKTGKAGNEKSQYLHLETLLLGEEPNLDERAGLQTQKDTLLDAQETAELITMEKSRVAVRALMAPIKTKREKEEDARALLGDEFDLIQAQVDHMKTCLQKDWALCDSEDGIISPTAGEDLLCPQLKARLEDGKPSPEQLQAIEGAYSDIASRKSKATVDPRENLNNTVGMTLATMTALEAGKKARYVNLLKDVREYNPKTPDKEPENEKEKRLMKLCKGLGGLVKKGVGRVGKQWPQMFGVYLLNKLKKEEKGPYANHEEFVAWMKEVGMHHLDQAM